MQFGAKETATSMTPESRLQLLRSVLQMVNGKWLPDFIERLKASAWHQLYLPLLPFTRVRTIVPSYYRIGR